jgi:hypothetical protein
MCRLAYTEIPVHRIQGLYETYTHTNFDIVGLLKEIPESSLRAHAGTYNEFTTAKDL